MNATARKKAILLLTDESVAQFFNSVLKQARNDIYVLRTKTIDQLDRISKTPDADMRLIAFCTGLIVPRVIIKRLRGNCFNFHPGPPERPGYMPAPFALREGDENYGVTFHVMRPKVDTGAIIKVARFPVPQERTQESLEIEAYKQLLLMVKEEAPRLGDIAYQYQPSGDQWSGVKTTRKDLDALIPV